MAFLDEDDSFPPVATEPEERHRPPPERQRVFMARRLGAVAVGILILVLIVLGVRGCLNARKERAYENYVRDLTSLSQQAQQISETFFGRFDDPQNLTELQFETEIRADRSTAEGLVSRAQSLDPPGDVSGAQSDIVKAYELRRDGLAAVADNIGKALGDEDSDVGREQIALHMQDFLASDVLYREARSDVVSVLRSEGIEDKLPQSQFLPDLTWLDETTVAEKLAGITGESGEVTGLHGLGVSSVTVGGTALAPDTTTSVSAGGNVEVEVAVDNQGDQNEADIPVRVTVTGGDQPVEAEETLGRISPGETKTVTIPLDPAPSEGTTATLEVFVEPVLGEQVTDNNEFTYDVSFE